MEYTIDNWYILVGAIVMCVVLVLAVICFFKLSKKEQLAKAREWLIYVCTIAEKELGGGTGKLKLRQVYDLFIVRFPWLAKIISFVQFSELVDDALVEMREMLEQNKAVKELVNNN